MFKRKIKVLHIITHLELGGAQKTTLGLIKRLNKENFEIHLLTSSQGYLVKELEKIKDIKFKFITHLKRRIDLFNDFFAFIELFNYIKKNRFDIVHTHSPKAGFLGRWSAKLAKVPIIIHTVHGFPIYSKENILLKKIYIWLERLTSLITDRLIVVCKSDLEKGISNGIGSKEKYVLIREGIENNFSINRFSCKIKKDSSYLIGMVGCLKPQKAPLDFVKMAFLVKQKFPHTGFILIGGGPLYKRVKKEIKKLNLEKEISLLGWREDAIDLISLFDIFVLTSLWEGLPLVILEAISLGKPIVATNVDGIREVVKNGENGFLVEPGDYFDLACKVNLLLEDRNLREKISRNNLSLNLFSEYNLDTMTKKTEELYFKLMEVKNVSPNFN